VNPNNRTGNRYVTFDLWETLIFDDPDSDEARGRMRCKGLQSVLAEHEIQLAIEDLYRAYDQSGPRFQVTWDTNEEVPILEQIKMIVESAAGKSITLGAPWAKVLEDAYVNPILAIPPKLSKDAPTVLAAVRSRGYKIGLISNTGRSPGNALRKLLNDFDVLKFFEATVFSNEVGRRKPDITIFDRAAQLLGAQNRDVVHVGDNPKADFWGARNAGMRAILLDQVPPNSSRWGPHSLFALARANTSTNELGIDSNLRMRSLTETPDLVDKLFLESS